MGHILKYSMSGDDNIFDAGVLGNASDIILSTLVQESSMTTISRSYNNPITTSSTDTPPTTTIRRLIHAATTTYNFTDYLNTNGTWSNSSVPGIDSNTNSTTTHSFGDGLSNLDLIWIIPIMILIILILIGLAFLLFYCIQKTEICLLRYCSCCFRCCKCCSKTSYLLRDEHAKLADDDANVLYMREMRSGRSRP